MQLAPVVSRITANVTALRSVIVAASLDAFAASIQGFSYPCAALLAPTEKAGRNEGATYIMQRVEPRWSVAIACQNLADMRGEAALAEIDTIRPLVRSTLLNWQPSTDYRPIEYGGGRLLYAADGVVIWADDFLTDYYVRAI